MDIEVLVALVLVITQLAKEWLKKLNVGSILSNEWAVVLLSLVVTVGVVIYKSNAAGIPLTLSSLWTVVAVFAIANGGKKLIVTLRPK